MKKIIYFIICFLFFTPIALADYSVDNYLVDITVLEDGSLNIIEIIKMSGVYNGFEKTVKYKNNYQDYKGDLLASVDKNLYNNSNLKINEVRAIDYSFDADIETYKKTGDLFQLVDEADKGDHSVYSIENIENGQIYKIYNPSKMNKDFYYEYTLENVVINHADVAEVAMYLFDDLNEDINNIVINIHISDNLNNLKIWTHGGEGVETKYIDQETITLNIKSIKKDDSFDFRLIFDNNIVDTTKTTNELVLDKIIDLENNLDLDAISPKDEEYKKLRNEAYNSVINVEKSYNRSEYKEALYMVSNLDENDRLKTDLLIRLMNVEPKIERREEISKVILTSIMTIWTIGLIIILYQIYKKYNHQINDEKFILNKEINPFKIGYLVKKKITNYDLASSLLFLIENEVIIFDEKRRTLKKNKSINLSSSEEKIIKIFFKDKNTITLEDMTYHAEEDFDDFLKNYSNWINFATSEAEDEKYYENLLLFKIIGIIYCILGIFLGLFLIDYNMYYSPIVIIVLAMLFLFYFIFIRKKTYKGLSEYHKYMDFKSKLLKGNINKDEVPYYLMYANSMGFFNKLFKKLNNYEKDRFRAKTIRNTVVITIKKAYESRSNAHAKYASIKKI